MNKILAGSEIQDSSRKLKIVPESVSYSDAEMRDKLLQLDKTCCIVKNGDSVGVCLKEDADESSSGSSMSLLAQALPLKTTQLGDPEFIKFHGLKMAYMTGSMANGIASENLVISSGKVGLLSSFGAAGLLPSRIEKAINIIQKALPDGPYAFNLIHSPSEDAIERAAVDLYLKYGVRTVEASAFLGLTPNIVRYRVAGLRRSTQNQVEITNRVIAKISRAEVASKFMAPAPEAMLNKLLEEKSITREQAQLAAAVPMADDITVEADSGGHTDNRPLVSLLPAIIALREQFQEQYGYSHTIRVGAAGGIGTPASALAAFMTVSYTHLTLPTILLV